MLKGSCPIGEWKYYNEDGTIKTGRKRQDFPDDYYVKGYRR